MNEPINRPPRSIRRAALRVGLLVGSASVFLLLNPLAARADDGDSGLVGGVAGAVGDVTETVAGAVDDVGQTVDEVTETVTDVVEETVPVVEDVLDTAIETVEDVTSPIVETVERTADDGVVPAVPVVGEPDDRTAPPGGQEPPGGARDGDDGVMTHRTALGIRLVALDASTVSAGRTSPATVTTAHRVSAPARPAGPIDPVGSAPAQTASGGADQPFNPRIPASGQDLAVLAAALLTALALVRTSRRETRSPSSPAFLSILERPG